MLRKLMRLATLVAFLAAAYGWSSWSWGQETGTDSTVSSTSSPIYAGYAGYSYGGLCRPWQYGHPDLFYNFYVPNNCGGVPAQMYLAPYPVPQLVGHTYYTYQPLMPHEFMYPHHRTYRSYYDDGRGIDRTKVKWYCNPVTMALKDGRQALTIPR